MKYLYSTPDLFFEDIIKYPHLCKSCGMCVGVCPTDAVIMEKNEFSQFIPRFIQEKCIYCMQCIRCCPGIDITDNTAENIGNYLDLYIGYADDPTFREKGSSGGVISALASWMLETGIINKEITLNTTQSAITPEISINQSKEDVNNCNGSKYVIYPICEEAKQIKKETLITALPCQSMTLRRMKRDKGYIFGLFCSKAYTSDLIKYISEKEKIPYSEINQINYRKGLWPGNVCVATDTKTVQIPLSRSYYTAIANGNYFTIQGCLFCSDYFNEKADISFGDPWGFKIDSEILAGKTIIVVRSEKGKDLIDNAEKNEIIKLEKISIDQILSGHKGGIFNKKRTLFIRLQLLKKMKLPLPKHNEDLSKSGNFVENIIEKYYFRNNFTYKRNYEKIFNLNKHLVFVERYIIHLIQTIFTKLFSH